MAALKMDGTVRKRRAPKRTTEEFPFWCELAFVRQYQIGLGVSQGKPSNQLSFNQMTPWYEVAGYNAGRQGMDQKQAFVALQAACAAHGFHRD